MLNELILQFQTAKNRQFTNDNELLDYIQWCYIYDKLSISDYRKLLQELDMRGAQKPTYFNYEEMTV